ncbi:MAG: domain S-box-containing protein [Lacunisphaera sp.]|nr:domain S-box-containing protein [Lacunisphaera sp.]MDB6165901.1 domain S-box-containing protein [Lacunisphaera sp.]
MAPPSTKDPFRSRSIWLPWLVFLVLLAVTVAAWWAMNREVRQTARARFDRLTERIGSAVRLRFDTAAHLLHGAAALPAASEQVTAAEWSVYLRKAAEQLDNGVVGLGYVEHVARRDVDAFEARVRTEGSPGFTVERAGRNEWMYVVTAIEPREHNTGVLGLDVGSGTTRRTAAEMAAAKNDLILSRRIRLDYEGRQVPGFLLFLPVYRPGMPLETPELRLAAVEGWVYAPIRIDQLMRGVAEVVSRQIDFEVFEGDGTRRDTLLYDIDGHLTRAGRGNIISEAEFANRTFHIVQPLEIYGQRWTIRFNTLPEFDALGFSYLPGAVLAVGTGVSLLAALLAWSLVNARRRALQLAESMTAGLRRAEEESSRLALVASRTASGVILTDRTWRVEWINEGFTRLFGFTLDEIKGREPVSFMCGPETDPKTLQVMTQAAEVGRPYLGEILHYAKDGHKVWVEQEIQPLLNAAGEVTGYMGLQLDITERKRQAAQLHEAKEAAEKANAAKGQFLAMMSHEIRTPMNGVIGMASLLLDSPLTDDQRESAETIRQSGEALLTIINDILDFSKIESGRLELEHTEFGLRDCLEGALDLLAGTAALKKIDLLYEIADGVPDMVRGDATRLRQILVNLLANAVKFTERGEVAVAVRALAWHPSGVELHFAIRDTGIGIHPENMERLFKPFSQVDASMTRRFGGTGLGLAICRRLVELMGGRISVESEVGRGSTFSFTLRLQEIPGDLPGGGAGAGQGLRGRRLLIVEDNATSRRILTDLTRNWGMEPRAVDTPAGALAVLREPGLFDAALIDVSLPEINGHSLARAIREIPARTDLPLVLLSGLGRREVTAGQFNAVVTKPVKPSQLFNVLNEIFWRRSGAAAAPALPAVITPAVPVEPPHPGRILLAEDNPVNQKVTLHQLRSLGCRADLAANGAEVLAALQRQSYDVVLMDLHMPVMGGLEAARLIHEHFPGAKRPWLIALTANTMPGDREQGLAAGLDDYLAKPVRMPDLAAALARAKLRVHA